MAKARTFKLLGGGSQDSLERFWAQTGIADAAVSARFFQLFGARGDLGGASEAALATGAASERSLTVRPFEWSVIVAPAGAVVAERNAAPGSAPVGSGSGTSRADANGEADAERIATLAVATSQGAMVATEAPSTGLARFSPQYTAVFPEDGSAGYVYDSLTKQLMPGGPGDYPNLFSSGLRMTLSGDHSEGVLLDGMLAIDSIELTPGDSYNLITGDGLVRAGQELNISGALLGADDHFLFDGSAETDGRFFIIGSQGSDLVIGGAGDDRFYGRGGADILNGGRGGDTFVYYRSSESTGADYDMIGDFDPGSDRIDLPVRVAGFGDDVEGGALSVASFDDDLSAALAGLGANEARWFAPDSGDLAGTIFLIVDGNGTAGYQEGEDFVFAIGGKPLDDLTGHTDFFI